MNPNQKRKFKAEFVAGSLPGYLAQPQYAFEHKDKFFHVEEIEEFEDGLHVMVMEIPSQKVRTAIVNKEELMSWCLDNDLNLYCRDSSDHNGDHIQESWSITTEEWYDETKYERDNLASFLNEQGAITWQGKAFFSGLLDNVFTGFNRAAL